MQLSDFTSSDYRTLNEWDWKYLTLQGVCNGCGGAGDKVNQRFMRWLIKWLLKRLRLVFLTADCNIHDFTYWQGGDEKRRLECDMGFFTAIMADIYKVDLATLSVLKYTLFALAFYYAVRISGKDYFNYNK